MTKKILIVEDEPIIATDIEMTLSKNGYSIVGIAYSSTNALDMLKNRSPDLVILDIAIKGDKDGIDLASIIRQHYSLPFIYLTSYSDKLTLERVKPTIPYGYIVKPFKDKDILTSIDIAFYKFEQEQKEKLLTREKADQAAVHPLTDMEFRVLSLIWEGNSNKLIADQLYISVNTIKTHLKNIYMKFEVSNRSELIVKLR